MSAFPRIDKTVGLHVLDLVSGCTFDDFILSPQRSVLERRDPSVIDLSSRLSRRITLKRPIVSANMDTVTRAPMAIVQAEEGGIGIIDRGFRSGEIEPQVREVEKVKRTQHGVIRDPWSVRADASLDEAASLMERTRVGTLVVVDDSGRLTWLLTERDMRFVTREGSRVADRMTPRNQLVVHEGSIEPDAAARAVIQKKIKKLPLVTRDGRLLGLITARDLVRQRRMPFATRDSQGRLRVGGGAGAAGRYPARAAGLL